MCEVLATTRKNEPNVWVNLKPKDLQSGPSCHFNLSPIHIGITHLHFYNQCSCEIFLQLIVTKQCI